MCYSNNGLLIIGVSFWNSCSVIDNMHFCVIKKFQCHLFVLLGEGGELHYPVTFEQW